MNYIKKLSLAAVLFVTVFSCRNGGETQKANVEKLIFAENNKILEAGQRASIGLTIEPKEAGKTANIEYSVSAKDIIEIDTANSSKEGVVFSALKHGSAVIMAKADGVVEYCSVTVTGETEIAIPYISLSESILEIPVGKKKYASAVLQGGSQADQVNFTFTNSNEHLVYMESANNTVIFEGLKKGMSAVTVSHPKAQYNASILLFTLNEGETARYITGENVVFMEIGQTKNYASRLVGIDDGYYNQTIYQVVDGAPVADALGTGESCTLKAKSAGVAKVRVTNQAIPDFQFEFQVVVQQKSGVKYITAFNTFYIINNMDTVSFNVRIEGEVPSDWADKLHYETDDTFISVNRVQDYFYVSGIKNGSTVLKINNDYTDFPCEILFVVQNQNLQTDEDVLYIKTSQKVIQMEAGKNAPAAILQTELVGGTGADQNNFEWVVEDSSVIEVTAPGKVTCRRSQVNVQQSYQAEAVITAKKPGTTKITVYNHSPKCVNEVTVMVKVYPFGTFNGQAVFIAGPSVIRLKEGQNTDIYTSVIGGNVANLGATVWEVGNSSIAEATGSGLYGNIRALPGASGVTTLKVTGENLAQDYEAVMVVYGEGEENSIPYIYTDNITYRLLTGQTIQIPVRHPNIPSGDISINVQNTNKDSIYHIARGDVIIVSGYDAGVGDLVITTNIPGCNTVTVHVLVESEQVNADRPYMIGVNGSDIQGIQAGKEITVSVSMPGAGENELKKLLYSTDDESVARIKGSNKNEVQIEGVKEGQTALKINHSKSINEKTVIIYVVKQGESVEAKIILGTEKQNFILAKNQSVFIRIITNAKDNDKKFIGIRGITNNQSVNAEFNENSRDSLIITGVNEGDSKITLWCYNPAFNEKKNLIDLDIFITVRENVNLSGEISYPDSIILVKNKYTSLKGIMTGGTVSGDDISYILEDSNIAEVSGNGLEAILKGKNGGETYLQVSCSSYNFYKKILVICAETADELETLYYITTSKSLYRIKKTEEIKINLGFGENGEPANAQFEWANTANNGAADISIQGNGKSAVIRGKNEGRAVIRVTCPAYSSIKPVEIIVEVTGNTVISDDYYRFMLDGGIEQIVSGNTKMIPVSVYYGNEYYDEDDILRPGVKLEDGYGGIGVEVSDTNVIDAVMGTGDNSHFLRIQAKSAGKSEITLSHRMIDTPAKLLVVVYNGEVPGDEFAYFVSQKHYLVNKNDMKTITVFTTGNENEAQSKLQWTNDTPEFFSLDARDKTKVIVTGLKSGSGRATIKDNAGNVETVYISVSSGEQQNIVSVATESIIILSLENDYQKGYKTNIIVNGGNTAGISWKKDTNRYIDTAESGLSCVLYPKEAGLTNLTVSGGGFEKTIIVKVVETEKAKTKTGIINIDQRYFKIQKDETVFVNPYYKLLKPDGAVKAVSSFDNKVVSWEKSEKGIAVTGKNAGIQTLTLSNDECENAVDIIFEVGEKIKGGSNIEEQINLVYMVTDCPVIILEPGHIDYYTVIRTVGEYRGNESDFKWSSDSPKIHLNAFGTFAFISVDNGGEYKGTITVRNEYCGENLTITVIVGEKYARQEVTEPYMYTEKTVYTMNKSDSSLLIPLEIRNMPNVNYNDVTVSADSNSFYCTFANGNIIVNATETGSGIIYADYKNLSHKIYIIIQELFENGAVYLTTSQNYVIVSVNAVKPITVSLVNYEEPDGAKITWKSDNTNVAQVVGSGKVVQVLGVGAGITKFTASHNKSFNSLNIIIKVLPSGSDEDVCYLTTAENVIETYVSNSSRQIIVTKVGGRSGAIEAVWSFDNPFVIGLTGSNNTAYITAKKAGSAKITVSDKEAGTLDIIVIVRESKPGDLFIFPSQDIVQITPGSANGVLQVTMPGIDLSDEKDFRWSLYTQMPSDLSVAKNGGSVVSIYAMGSRCSISGIYAGTARIKITHPKAAEAAYIVVQVTNFMEMKFAQHSVEIVRNETAYVVLEIPDYGNFTDKVKFSVDNTSSVSVIGTHRVALLSAQNTTGKAVVTAYIPDTGLSCTIDVTVVDEPRYNEPEILTSQSMFILSPREAPFYISAKIIGFGINDEDSEFLQWTINYDDAQRVKPMLKIFPENTGDATKGISSIGKTVLIEVQQYPGKVYTDVEYCTLTLSHPATGRKRVLYFQIQEDSNAFTISRNAMTLESGQQMELTCNILNGSLKDYDEVVWEAKRDSIDPGKDIVKVIGRGKSVQILGMTDGQTVVTASYRGLNSRANFCTVTVKSVYYFTINFQNVLAYPGQKDDNGSGMFGIGYSVRPPNAVISWLDTANETADVSPGAAIDDGSGTGQGKIYMDLKKEGSFTIIGQSNNKVSRVNVTVREIFNFQILERQVNDEYPYMYAENGKRRDKSENQDGYDDIPATPIITGGYAIPYMVTPATASIKLMSSKDQSQPYGYKDKDALVKRGWDIIIGRPKAKGLSAYGYIYIKNRLEDRVNLRFRLVKPDGSEVQPATEFDREILFISRFPKTFSRIIPVFQQISGPNTPIGMNTGYPIKQPAVPTANTGYIKVYEESNIKGKYLVPKSGSVAQVSETDKSDTAISDEYNITVYDGEEHYIILDKAHPNAVVSNIELSDNLNPDISSYFSGNRGFKYDYIENLNSTGLSAIRISGGKDFAAYTRYTANKALSVTLKSDYKYDGVYTAEKGQNKMKPVNLAYDVMNANEVIVDTSYYYFFDGESNRRHFYENNGKTFENLEIHHYYHAVPKGYYLKTNNGKFIYTNYITLVHNFKWYEEYGKNTDVYDLYKDKITENISHVIYYELIPDSFYPDISNPLITKWMPANNQYLNIQTNSQNESIFVNTSKDYNNGYTGLNIQTKNNISNSKRNWYQYTFYGSYLDLGTYTNIIFYPTIARDDSDNNKLYLYNIIDNNVWEYARQGNGNYLNKPVNISSKNPYKYGVGKGRSNLYRDECQNYDGPPSKTTVIMNNGRITSHYDIDDDANYNCANIEIYSSWENGSSNLYSASLNRYPFLVSFKYKDQAATSYIRAFFPQDNGFAIAYEASTGSPLTVYNENIGKITIYYKTLYGTNCIILNINHAIDSYQAKSRAVNWDNTEEVPLSPMIKGKGVFSTGNFALETNIDKIRIDKNY